MAHISVVIPVYKAEGCLEELCARLKATLESITDDFQIVLVEDCGPDNSWAIIRKLAQGDRRIRGLQFSRNFGQHYGITAGLDYADGDWVVVMDCDLQDRPEDIPSLYAKALTGYDVILARRMPKHSSALKSLTAWAFYKLFSFLSGTRHDGSTGNFRIMSRKVVEHFRTMRERLRFFGGLVAWMGFPTAYVDVSRDERPHGVSSYTYLKLLKLAAHAMIAYSNKPLYLSAGFGFIISLLSFAYGLHIVFRKFMYDIPIPGWSSLITSIYFLGGVIICILGMLGVYLGQVFEQTKNRPLYIIRRSTSDEHAE